MDDDSDKIISLDNLVNVDEGISLRQLKQFKRNVLDPALTQLQTALTEIESLKTFKTNAITKSNELETKITALEAKVP